MSRRVFNFSAGPSVLPLPVLERISEEMTCFSDTGVSILELGHRTAAFTNVLAEAIERLRRILKISDEYEVFFVQGGGRFIFSVLPMNFCLTDQPSQVGDYLVSGTWGASALAEASNAGRGHCVWDGATLGYKCLPDVKTLLLSPDAAYLHYTSNETIEGVQFQGDLKSQLVKSQLVKSQLVKSVPVICDMSSDFLSRPIDIQNYDMVYACIQKNLGPAGATLVIAKRELLNRSQDRMPGYCNLRNHAAAKSMYNTPPTFCIYVANLVLQWFEEVFGDLETIGEFNRKKSQLIYDAIAKDSDVYQLHAQEDCRSQMNVTFRLPDTETEKRLLVESEAAGLAFLAGHRSVGGIRASLYNAMPMEGAEALAGFLAEFAYRAQNV